MTEEIRTCANCACHHLQEMNNNSLQKQSFCRRNTPAYGVAEVEVPRLDKDKNPTKGRDGKLIMERAQQGMYLYPPTLPTLVCYDGWRPMGSLPGARKLDSKEIAETMAATMDKLQLEAERRMAELVALEERKN